MSFDEEMFEAEEHFDKSLTSLENSFKRIRTGKASAQMIEHVQAEAYGAMTPINQMAGISIPEPSQILIKPWDKNVLHAIEKALVNADLGMAPSNDGDVIRLNVPPLSEERRKQLASQAKEFGENCKVAMRNVRRDVIKAVETKGKEEKLPEDLVKKTVEDVTQLLKDYEGKAEKLLADKIEAILEF